MNTGDFMTVETLWTVPFASNPCVNVWHLECQEAGEPTELQTAGPLIVEAFIARYVTPLLGYQASNIRLVGMKLRSITDLTEGYDVSGVLASGTAVSINLPPFVTYSVREQRRDLTTRNGRKAFVGAHIGSIQDGGIINATIAAAMNTAMDDWATGSLLVEGPDYAFVPRILRLSPTPGSAPLVVNGITSFIVTGMGSQNSRK
jgi:hypothetical protein